MNYRYMGETGLKVSELCLGTMTFGRESDEATSQGMLDRFTTVGGTFLDTADVYGQGTSEEIVGRWLAHQQRDDLVIATKVFGRMGDGPNDEGVSRKRIVSAVEASLRRLQTDYLDLYYVHLWDDGTPLEETLATLNTLVERGLVRYLGASNYSGWQLQKALELSRQRGWEPFTCLQPHYNLLTRSTEWELLPVCTNEGLGVMPWSPLRGGWLSGKFRRGMAAPPGGTRVRTAEDQGGGESWRNVEGEATWRTIDALLEVAEETRKTPAQVAINWLLCQPGVTSPIIGVRTLEQLEDNMGATGWALNGEQLAKLNRASDAPLPYPYDVLKQISFPRRH